MGECAEDMAMDVLNEYAAMFAFAGNSLLQPISQTQQVGLDPDFWSAFPRFGTEDVACAAQRCEAFARRARAAADRGTDVVQQVSVEWTRLFVGPPKPAAAPWETLYRSPSDEGVGFGAATFEMRELLREAGLQLSNENHQYEDHIGIELLYLSHLCAQAAAGAASRQSIVKFAENHPLAWIDALAAKVAQAYPEGYVWCVLALAMALLKSLQ
jgi:TorA maturation chaperone TorD